MKTLLKCATKLILLNEKNQKDPDIEIGFSTSPK